ncbi:MAG: class I SAM-dependent methyltransferase [Devosia sp.]|nr:MAG: class I SAM-dependent methyltransferase [Devosia sp.]
MTQLLLGERVPGAGRVLVLGAGGGIELDVLASAHAEWTFDGVDPSDAMLDTARQVTRAHADRIRLHTGTIAVAPEGPFDAATCLLVFHFVPLAERLRTLRGLRQRLVTGAPLVLAHMSFPQDEASREVWMRRHAAFAVSNGVDPAHAESGRRAMLERLHLMAPEDEEAMLAEAGFADISLFYAGFDFRGWVAYAG